jgi:surface-anchored protein
MNFQIRLIPFIALLVPGPRSQAEAGLPWHGTPDATLDTSGPTAYTFRRDVGAGGERTVLTQGHTDLAIDYAADAEAWNVHVVSDALEQSYDADEVLLQIPGEAKTMVPADPRLEFLGKVGDSVWILPEGQTEELLHLGFGGEGVPLGVFVDDAVRVTLRNVTGPGDFLAYTFDGFGDAQVVFNTRNGITEGDFTRVEAGGDAHLNWVFTQPGNYSVTFEVSGFLAGGNRAVSSGPVTFSFLVLRPPVQLTNEHVDLAVIHDPAVADSMRLVVVDEDHGIQYSAQECFLVANESSRRILPAGTPFGNEGDVIYVLPQSQSPDLLYLGISAEDIPSGIFAGSLRLRLRSVIGPGNFHLWQADQFGGFNVRMNSADGITDQDETLPLVGGHEHYNWGFSTTGVYRITFRASGRRIGAAMDLTTPDSTFVFHVLPLPLAVPRLRVASVTSQGEARIELSGTPGATHHIEASNDMKTWAPFQEVVLIQSPMSFLLPLSGPNRFVRAIANAEPPVVSAFQSLRESVLCSQVQLPAQEALVEQ